MTLDKVKERITQWFMSEMSEVARSSQTDDPSELIAAQFTNELRKNGMLAH